VEQSDVIDRISLSPDGRVMLSISDHLPWLPFTPHHAALLAKINAYLEFIESGQIFEDYPKARDRSLELRVFCKYRPTEDGLAFFARVSPQIERYKVTFAYGPVFGLGYDDDEA
jgi:hypothetical protein